MRARRELKELRARFEELDRRYRDSVAQIGTDLFVIKRQARTITDLMSTVSDMQGKYNRALDKVRAFEEWAGGIPANETHPPGWMDGDESEERDE